MEEGGGSRLVEALGTQAISNKQHGTPGSCRKLSTNLVEIILTETLTPGK
jgi:hypothetical protein